MFSQKGGWRRQDFSFETGVHLFSVQHDLLELACLGKALNDLVGDISSEVDAQSQGGVRRLNQISQLLRALQLQNIYYHIYDLCITVE